MNKTRIYYFISYNPKRCKVKAIALLTFASSVCNKLISIQTDKFPSLLNASKKYIYIYIFFWLCSCGYLLKDK